MESDNNAVFGKNAYLLIKGVIVISSKGTVVVGHLSSGSFSVNENIKIFDNHQNESTVIKAIFDIENVRLVEQANNIDKKYAFLITLGEQDIRRHHLITSLYNPNPSNKLNTIQNQLILNNENIILDHDLLTAGFNGFSLKGNEKSYKGFNPISGQEINIKNISKFSYKDIKSLKEMLIEETSKSVSTYGTNTNPFYEINYSKDVNNNRVEKTVPEWVTFLFIAAFVAVIFFLKFEVFS